MWLAFWKTRNRFSLEELSRLTDQLQKVQIVNEVNQDLVIEALRSIAEIVTYGDQNDPTFFDFFMEKQVMGEFARILKVSKTLAIALQILQTVSIMIQNLRSERALYHIFSTEHVNYLITYPFDFRNEELLSYYISFLRAISGKLTKSTVPLLLKTESNEVVSFPLYIEAIQLAFHEESMVRIAVRAVTLNVYHVGDECVNRYVTGTPMADYFSNLITYFRKLCLTLDERVSGSMKNPSPESNSFILAAVDEIEDSLYYFSDIISSGIPDLGKLIAEKMLQLFIFPLLFPSLRTDPSNGAQIGAITSLYLFCCIVRILKIKNLANTIAVALLCLLEAFTPRSEVKQNGNIFGQSFTQENHCLDRDALDTKADNQPLKTTVPTSPSSSQIHSAEDFSIQHNCNGPHLALREVLLSYIVHGDEIKVLGSLNVLATLLQTKELDESMLDALGILPQRKQHKKLLLQALVGEGPDEEQLFSPEGGVSEDGVNSQIDKYLQTIKDQYGWSCSCIDLGISPRVHRFQVVDALVSLFCRSNISAETLWDGGWLLRQLLPYSEAEFSSHHHKLLLDAYKNCSACLLLEVRGVWSDLLTTVLTNEWKKCKRAIEASSPQKEPKCVLLPPPKFSLDVESSFSAGERMYEMVKVFVLRHQLQIFSSGGTLPDQPPINSPTDPPGNSRLKSAGLDHTDPKPGTEISIVGAVPCRIAFERGKERHFFFLAVSRGTSGWILLIEEQPSRNKRGVVRVAAPLAGSNPRVDDKHMKWLHLRIRPSSLPFLDLSKFDVFGNPKSKALIDGRWTLAFRDDASCQSALSMILEEIDLQTNEVGRRLQPLFDLSRPIDELEPSSPVPETSPIRMTMEVAS